MCRSFGVGKKIVDDHDVLFTKKKSLTALSAGYEFQQPLNLEVGLNRVCPDNHLPNRPSTFISTAFRRASIASSSGSADVAIASSTC